MGKTRFLSYLKHQKRYSVNTILAYQTDIEQFEIFLQSTYDLFSVIKVESIHIRSWLAELVEQQISNRSINRKRSSLKSFYKYLKSEGLIDSNPTEGLSALKTPFRLPTVLESDAIEQLIEERHFENNFEGQRDKLIVTLLYETGMRLGELVNLKLLNFDFPNRSLIVKGKGQKERQLFYSPSLQQSLEAYLEQRTSLMAETLVTDASLLLFTSKGKPIYPRLVQRLLDKLLPYVTTSKHRNPHTLRHTFATTLLNNGADINAIKELLGHSSLAATQVYTHYSIEKIKDVYKKAHPKA